MKYIEYNIFVFQRQSYFADSKQAMQQQNTAWLNHCTQKRKLCSYRMLWCLYGRAGKNRTFGVSDVTDLQSAALAATLLPDSMVIRTGLEPVLPA